LRVNFQQSGFSVFKVWTQLFSAIIAVCTSCQQAQSVKYSLGNEKKLSPPKQFARAFLIFVLKSNYSLLCLWHTSQSPIKTGVGMIIASIERIIEILKNAGYKYTKPRRVVTEILVQSRGHLSAPEIVEAVAAVDDTIGRMSVYRTLDLFTRLGILRPAFQEGSIARYVVMVDGHHHHIICYGCGQVIHFDQCPLDELTDYLEKRFDCHIRGHLLEFFGECAECREANSAPVTPHPDKTLS
jgi:Fur family ferric uptake transcriptional regulator